ncbi:MAG: hypothetical protein QM736_05570 [Vicinamibacterales bacterium]
MFDSRYVTLPLTLIEPGFDPSALPSPGARLAFAATAYCAKGLITSAGVQAQTGVTAADPSLLPMGSVVQLDFRDDKYDGIYTVLDTGPAVQGRRDRPLHVELQRGNALRPAVGPDDDPPPRVESARDHARLLRSVQEARAARAGSDPFASLPCRTRSNAWT